ncbi:hypothetical protein L227DRAFT_581302 [Lentinus tigrinus ALCF2SS1-6]|uniref:Uncharacterized protein n=1 Tax=Lentinus tigrinus ALCF2SS1-6 TaxID=1328759 RepID=A0A5C2RPJ9_9APHY|nr:hypothetical protein L227DRAFT_581302 [Lentinus tigrinus ALCF2SS1-6]
MDVFSGGDHRSLNKISSISTERPFWSFPWSVGLFDQQRSPHVDPPRQRINWASLSWRLSGV